MLVLDHLHQRLHNNLPDETTLHNGQKFDLLCLGLLGVPSLADLFNDLSTKLQELKFDLSDYICIKFLMLLNHGEFRVKKFCRFFSIYDIQYIGPESFYLKTGILNLHWWEFYFKLY